MIPRNDFLDSLRILHAEVVSGEIQVDKIPVLFKLFQEDFATFFVEIIIGNVEWKKMVVIGQTIAEFDEARWFGTIITKIIRTKM